jgi:hypothetical protein
MNLNTRHFSALKYTEIWDSIKCKNLVFIKCKREGLLYTDVDPIMTFNTARKMPCVCIVSVKRKDLRFNVEEGDVAHGR